MVLNHKEYKTWKVSYKYLLQNIPSKHSLTAYEEDFDHTIYSYMVRITINS